jgi:ABC-type nickel/cobalt efflux system permease component RcnA
LISGLLLLGVALLACWRGMRRTRATVDRDEILVIRHVSDRIRREQVQPFD